MMIAGYAIAWGVICNDEFVVGAGAFHQLIQRGFQPQMLLEHEGEEIGRWLKIREDDRGLLCVGEVFSDSPRAQLARDLMVSGKLPGLSLGRKETMARPIASGISFVRQVLRIDEISLVEEPRCPAALIDSICEMGAG
ncbi:HK97 family phage prohead protease [Mesorhizobium kowhaii]|nr:HK97 family phage prohead protease [Mesorhizobium kowhaii]